MRRPWKKLKLALVACGPLILVPLVGCDAVESVTGQADRAVQRQIRQAQAQQVQGQDQEALRTLEQAAGEKAAGPVTRARALSLLAEAELDAAATLVERVNANQVQISRLLAETANLGTQIQNLNLAIENQRKREPVAARADIAARIAAAKGGPDQPDWFKHEQTPLPTLSKVKQDASSLDGQITKLEGQLKELGAQRADLLKQADAAIGASEAAKGQESVDLYKRGSNLRKQAAEVSVRIDQTNAALAPLRDALAIARDQEQRLDGVVQRYQQQLDQIEAGWKAVAEKIAQQQALRTQIAQGKESDGDNEQLKTAGTVAGKAALLAALARENAALRESAVGDINNASAHLEQAATAADALQAELARKLRDPATAQSPQRQAWKQLADAVSPMRYRLRQAAAQQALASVYSEQFRGLTTQLALTALLQEAYAAAELKLPEFFTDGELSQRRDTVYGDATRSFEQSEKLLQTVLEAPSAADLRPAALVSRMLSHYGWYQLERTGGNSDAAQGHLQVARDLAREAQAQNVAMPSLPPELRSAQASAAPAPGAH